jgi:hypothetical protein
MDTRLEWVKSNTSAVAMFARQGDYCIKAVPVDKYTARASIEIGTTALISEGIPATPIIESWEDEQYQYFVCPWADDVEWDFDKISAALDIADRAFDAGVVDLYQDNWGEIDGRLVIRDVSELVEDVELDRKRLEMAQDQLLHLLDW